jgi:hypothetical protein
MYAENTESAHDVPTINGGVDLEALWHARQQAGEAFDAAADGSPEERAAWERYIAAGEAIRAARRGRWPGSRSRSVYSRIRSRPGIAKMMWFWLGRSPSSSSGWGDDQLIVEALHERTLSRQRSLRPRPRRRSRSPLCQPRNRGDNRAGPEPTRRRGTLKHQSRRRTAHQCDRSHHSWR